MQRSTLFEWLADHSYTEVQELIAAEPPVGFGFSVGKATLCRFYKAHYVEIDRVRQAQIGARAAETSRVNIGGDYVSVLQDSSKQLLLERYFEMLSRPVESIDDLKKLVVIGDKIRHFHNEQITDGDPAADLFHALQLAKVKTSSPPPDSRARQNSPSVAEGPNRRVGDDVRACCSTAFFWRQYSKGMCFWYFALGWFY